MTDPTPSMRERYVGCLIGSALGDALGKLTEHLDYDQILYQFGPDGITEPPANALYTDDTQLAMATARALLAAGRGQLGLVMECMVKEYMRWYDLQGSPVHRRAPGTAIIDALSRIHRGVPYGAAADGGANDSITATRSVPVALRYHGDLRRIVEAGAEISRMTHGHPAAVAGGAASALYVEYALSGVPLGSWIQQGTTQLRRFCPETPRAAVEAIRAVERTLGWAPEDAMERQFHSRPGYGGGWTAEEAVALGLWCFLSAPRDYLATVRLAANAPGLSDTDAIAAVAGAISGAYNGLQAIPADWIARLESADEIRSLAEQLYDLREGETAMT